MEHLKYFLRLFILVLSATVFFIESYAQDTGISVSPGTHISTDLPDMPFAETFLAINPRDSRNLVATSLVISDGLVLSKVYNSRDGGLTWQRAKATSADKTPFNMTSADPVVYFDTRGTAFFATLAPSGLLLSRSGDGGTTWEPPVTVPGGLYDREYLAFDDTGGRLNGNMYAGGVIQISETNGRTHNAIEIVSSLDKGRTFSPGRIITGDWTGEDVFVMLDLLVTADGKLIVPFMTISNNPSLSRSAFDSPRSGRLRVMVSEDGGRTFSPSKIGPPWAGPEGGYRAIKSWGAPRAAIDLSHSRFRGRIHVVWTQLENKRYVVKTAYSTDLGSRWSVPRVVNDNANGGEPADPAITVNKDGIVGIAFNDRRDDPANSCFRLYFAASVDGGETFLPNVKASEKPTCPLTGGNWAIFALSEIDPPDAVSMGEKRPMIALSGIPQRWPNGGDTQGLVADPEGVFHSAWINGESGVLQLWSKELRVDQTKAFRSPFAESRKDLSGDLALEVSNPNIDLSTHRLSVKVRLLNRAASEIRGPFSIVLDDVATEFSDLRTINSDNGLGARGAEWNFTADDRYLLQAHQESEERVLCWEFSGGLPNESSMLFQAHFIILGETGK